MYSENPKRKNTMDAVERKYTRQKWTVEERTIIASTLTDDVDLEAIKTLIPLHDEVSVLREVHRSNGYGIRTMEDGTKRFFADLKTRNRSKNEKTGAVVSRPFAPVNIEVDNNQHKIIITKKVVNTGKELRLLALDLLFRENLIITDQSVKQTVRLLSLFRKEIA